MDWKEEYKRKLVTPEDAVKVVKSGDRVMVLGRGAEPEALETALVKRKDELRNVELCTFPRTDYAWFHAGMEESFTVNIMGAIGPLVRPMVTEKRNDFFLDCLGLWYKPEDEGRPSDTHVDVAMVVVSPPDENGICSFGHCLNNKRSVTRRARKVLAEVNESPQICIRTFGENYVHISEIDYFVENTIPVPSPEPTPPPTEDVKVICGYISELIKDGDCIEVGAGVAILNLANLGAFDGKKDLALHTGMITPRMVEMIGEGVFNGKRRNIHTGKAVISTCDRLDIDLLLRYIHNNPAVEYQDYEYMHHPRMVALNDNFVGINGAMGVDLTGQIASETWGYRIFSTAGGLPGFAFGAILSKGGRSIIVLPATAAGGKASRIVDTFPPGTVVSIPRTFADYIVTEFGVAQLLGKSQRQRALELISVAHPDFRAELKQQAEKLFWP